MGALHCGAGDSCGSERETRVERSRGSKDTRGTCASLLDELLPTALASASRSERGRSGGKVGGFAEDTGGEKGSSGM
eukprot:6054934-Prymnesium_polylepis.3